MTAGTTVMPSSRVFNNGSAESASSPNDAFAMTTTSSTANNTALEELIAQTKAQGGMCGELLKLTQPRSAKGKFAAKVYIGGKSALLSGKLKGKWQSRFVFITATRILYYKSSAEYFAHKPAKKVC